MPHPSEAERLRKDNRQTLGTWTPWCSELLFQALTPELPGQGHESKHSCSMAAWGSEKCPGKVPQFILCLQQKHLCKHKFLSKTVGRLV